MTAEVRYQSKEKSRPTSMSLQHEQTSTLPRLYNLDSRIVASPGGITHTYLSPMAPCLWEPIDDYDQLH